MRSEESPLWICFSPPNGQRDQPSSQQRSHQYLKVGGMISTSAHTHTHRSPALQNTIARKHNPVCATGSWNNEPMGTRGLLGLHHLPLWRSRTCPNPWEFCKLQYSPSFSFDTILRGDPSLDSSSLRSLEFLLCKTRMVAKPLKTCWWKKQGPEQVILEQQTQGSTAGRREFPVGSHWHCLRCLRLCHSPSLNLLLFIGVFLVVILHSAVVSGSG